MARRRTRENTLSSYWSKKERDLVYHWPKQKCDGHLLYGVMGAKRMSIDLSGDRVGHKFDPSFVDELDARGYDLTTLRFSVMLKEDKTDV